MSKGKQLRSFDYVNQPYERVRDALLADAGWVLSAATRAAATRARSMAAELRVNIGGMDVGTEIALTVGRIEVHSATSGRRAHIPIEWEAAKRPRLFPFMSGELAIYPLSATETQLEFAGTYEPPLGALGDALDAAIGHRIAEASVQGLVANVARYLREKLPEQPDSDSPAQQPPSVDTGGDGPVSAPRV